MYGLVNRALEDMVRLHHGEAIWDQIKTRAGVEVDLFFGNESYPDDLTYRLVGAASEVLQMPAERVLEAFGEHWVLHTAQEGYGGLMGAAGKTLREFLINLPNFHTRVAMVFPKLQPPRFQVTDLKESSLCLHYHTERQGLTPFVVGLLRGLGQRFQTAVRVSPCASRATGSDHDIFLVEWDQPSPP